jgi:uncharacterized protein YggE
MATVTVSGTARASVRPDRATLDLGLTHVAVGSSDAMDEVARRSQELAGRLRDLGVADRAWSTQGISVAEEWEWKHDTNTRVGYRATSGITVTIEDLELVSPLLRSAVDVAGAQVRDLRWSVSPDNPANDALLGAAALDGRRRAIAYATALGLVLGAVEEISDLPMSWTGASRSVAADAMLRMAKTGPETPGMAVNPGEVELIATVFIRFGTVTPG